MDLFKRHILKYASCGHGCPDDTDPEVASLLEARLKELESASDEQAEIKSSDWKDLLNSPAGKFLLKGVLSGTGVGVGSETSATSGMVDSLVERLKGFTAPSSSLLPSSVSPSRASIITGQGTPNSPLHLKSPLRLKLH